MNNSKSAVRDYLKRPAEQWVSTFVLLGCVVICLVLVYSAYKAQVLGAKLSLHFDVDINKQIEQAGS